MTKVIFMGTPDFSTKVLEMLIEEHDVIAVVTQPDRPVGRKRVLTPPPVKRVAEEHNLPVFQPEKLAQSDELAQLLQLEPDLIVTAAFGQLLPDQLLQLPKLGAINVHHHYYLNTVVVRPYIKQLLMVKLKQESRSCIWLKS